MRRLILFPVAIFASLILMVLGGGCVGTTTTSPAAENKIELYVSLGPYSHYPDSAPADYSDLTKYWGKTVRFSVKGLDSGVNDDVDLSGSDNLNWTGGDIESGTQFASSTFSLNGPSGEYAGGRFKFQIYIDWNGNNTMDAGDVYMENYSIIADKDNDPGTVGEEVVESEYGDSIVYNGDDHSITINDPLTYNSGFAWKVEDIHEGDMGLIQ